MRLLLALALAVVMLSAPAWAEAPLSLEGSAAPSPWQRYRDWTRTHWDTYNTLASPNVTPPHGAEIVLKEVTGDPARGQKLAFDRSRGGGCLACHVMGPRRSRRRAMSGPTCRRSASSAAPTSGCSTTSTTRASTTPSR